MGTSTDDQGRLYLPAELRRRYGERYHIVQYPNRIELIPIADDPLEAIRAAVGDALEGKRVEALREDALQRAREEAVNDLGDR